MTTITITGSGGKIYAGLLAPSTEYAWAASLAPDAWTSLGMPSYATWLAANIPAGAYLGSNPYNAGVDAYAAPAFNPVTGEKIFNGAGHSDSTMNGGVRLNEKLLTWNFAWLPTPPAKYPSTYGIGATIIYPSGLSGLGFFLNGMTDSRDIPFNTPRMRSATHQYGGMVFVGVKVEHFYGLYGAIDPSTGAYDVGDIDLGAQIYAKNSNFGIYPPKEGTMAVYDEVTDKVYIALGPGSDGANWRSTIIQWNPNTKTIDNMYDVTAANFLIINSPSLVRVGRKIYIFCPLVVGGVAYPDLNQGAIWDMDTKTYTYFSITGDLAGGVFDTTSNQFMESIPACYYTSKNVIMRYNYRSTEKSKMYTVNLTPVSGTGSAGSPFILTQTGRTIGGAIPSIFSYLYRLDYNPAADCVVLVPHSTVPPVAFRLG